MRLLTISKLLVLGAATAYVYKRSRRTQQQQPVNEDGVAFADLLPDPGDPVQGFDEAADLHVLDLDLDAIDADDAEASIDQAIFESDLDTSSATTLESIDFSTVTDSEEGQNWVEALETSAAEYGAAPEVEIDPTADLPLDLNDMRDTPVADRGSGGPSGL